MALKTMLRQMLSKWGILSEELQKAIEDDQSVIIGDSRTYVDNPSNEEKVTKPKDMNSLNSIPKNQEQTTLEVEIDIPTQQTPKELLINELKNRGATEEEAGKWCYGKNENEFNSYLNDPASIDSILEEIKGF